MKYSKSNTGKRKIPSGGVLKYQDDLLFGEISASRRPLIRAIHKSVDRAVGKVVDKLHKF
jgi:hypothetical protein